MKNFLGTLFATTIAFAVVVFGKQAYDDYRVAKAAEIVVATTEKIAEAAQEEAELELNARVAALVESKEELESWQIIDNSNSVTGNRTITVSKLSADYEGALVFRCYDDRNGRGRRYDYFFVFPEDLFGYKEDQGWVMYQLDEAKPVASSIKKATSDYSASFFVVSDEANAKRYPALYGGELASVREYWPEFYRTLNDQSAEYFNNVLDAKMLKIVAEQHGKISEQTMVFDVAGIGEAIQPVIEYCERKSLI